MNDPKTDNPNVREQLQPLREGIDALDAKIVDLVNQRAEIVIEVGKIKNDHGATMYAPDREAALYQRLEALNKGPLPADTLRAMYRELISGSYALEQPLRIGYLGPEGSFSHLASIRQFGQSVQHQPLLDIRAVFQEVTRGHCDYGLVPVENSLGGGIIETMDCLIDETPRIVGEIYVPIHHNLLATCPIEEIQKVASKPEIFAQCRNWLSVTLPGIECVPAASSSKAASLAATESNLAAIGSELAARLYGLNTIFSGIEDDPNNQTRFFVIGREEVNASGYDKTSVMFTTAHKSGALVDVLEVFRKYDVNLTNIDNRPSKRRNWEYYFFVDLEGHSDDPTVSQALEEVAKHCKELHVLGSFPRSDDRDETNPL